MRDHTQRYHHFICITDVLELNVIQEDDDGYTFGSAVTIASMEETFKESVEKLPGKLSSDGIILRQSEKKHPKLFFMLIMCFDKDLI